MASDGGGAAGGGGGDVEESSPPAAAAAAVAKSAGGGDESASSSPRNRVKFLCSYGGKILPRPADGHLKYVGGETRVVAIPRDTNFSELMKRLNTIVEGDIVLKYQIIPEDLDALVTVRTDEDVKHMLDEHDRHESEGNPKLRAFLFPSNPVVIENQVAPMDCAIEQRYIDAINGVVRTSANVKHSTNANQPCFTISSGCSSPKCPSPDGQIAEPVPTEPILMNGYQTSRLHMHKVHSSPSICCLNSPPHQSVNLSNPYLYQQLHPYHQNQQQHHIHGYQPTKQPSDPHYAVGHERLSLALGQADFARVVAPGPNPSHYFLSRRLGSGGHSRYAHLDECLVPNYARLDRSDSVPR